jgi:dienelactone hydrolase
VRGTAAAALCALAVVLAGCGSSPQQGGERPGTVAHTAVDGRSRRGVAGPEVIRLAAGRGATGAWEFRRADLRAKRLPVVLFVHGWGGIDPRTYRGWIEHLALRGNAVIYPRYQDSVVTPPATVLGNLVLGLRAALALRGAPVDASTLVAVGHSAGGALVADYAASAPALHLPRPRAILAAYPGRALGPDAPAAIPEIAGRDIPAATRIVALAGDADEVVGTRWARRIVTTATRVPKQRRRFRLITGDTVDDHQAPARTDAVARASFWAPFDALAAAARRAP